MTSKASKYDFFCVTNKTMILIRAKITIYIYIYVYAHVETKCVNIKLHPMI